MEFIIKDYDSIGEHEILGSALVSKKDILEGTGERTEYELSQYSGKNSVFSKGAKKVRDRTIENMGLAQRIAKIPLTLSRNQAGNRTSLQSGVRGGYQVHDYLRMYVS